MPKVKRDSAAKSLRHNPLAEEIIEDRESAGLRRVPHEKRNRAARAGEEDEEGGVLPARVTQKILEIAQSQKAGTEDDGGELVAGMANDGEDDGEMADEVSDIDVEVDDEGYFVAPSATEEEERALSLFLPGAGAKKAGPTLGDIILQKIQEHEAKKNMTKEEQDGAAEGMSPKVVQVYGEIGKWLRHYKSGKMPKAFKVLPSLSNWEEALALTSPLTWSPAAMYEATSLFASNLNPRMAQRFFNLVLLPAVRQNIAEYKKLNFHYFRALRKALFKPAAFFKGILLPLATESCTLREAMILSAVLGKASIPANHSAATMARLSEMTPWYSTTSIILTALLNKKYALPLRVIESLTAHFSAFSCDAGELPVVWHRALLIFVQRYKYEFNDDQKRRIKELLRVHFHESIGHEVRRELLAPKPGEAPTAGESAMDVS
mmetsp:Transcript_40787/g.89166  ORF Transcript_40787/g.89166 Transcript_40787/m.89166 type:complete len:434 (-) Transcript_40787:48-1349(-)